MGGILGRDRLQWDGGERRVVIRSEVRNQLHRGARRDHDLPGGARRQAR